MRLFALNGSERLGAAIALALGTALDLHEEREFDGGEHKTRPLVPVRSHHVFIVHSLAGGPGQSANDRLLRLLFLIGACREHGAASVTAIAPYLAYARKDRQTKPFDPVTTRYVAQLFEAVGTDAIVALDIHNPAAFQNAFRCRTANIETIELFAADIARRYRGEQVTVVSPDAGGTKRTLALKTALDEVLAAPVALAFVEKHRSAGVVSGSLFAGEVAGRTAIIVDDMVSSGGTILRAALACRDRGASRVVAYATHGAFNPGAQALFAAEGIDALTVTDSIVGAHNPGYGTFDKLDVLSCAPLLARAIEGLSVQG